MTKSPHHCRDYRATNGTLWRVVFNDGKGSGAAQRIYQIVQVDKKNKLVLMVQFENTVVILDKTAATNNELSTQTTDQKKRQGIEDIPNFGDELKAIFGGKQ